MMHQDSLFDVGDPAGDELVYATADGATVAAASLFQSARPSTPAELAADDEHRAQIDSARARLADHAGATERHTWQFDDDGRRASCTCGWELDRRADESERAWVRRAGEHWNETRTTAGHDDMRARFSELLDHDDDDDDELYQARPSVETLSVPDRTWSPDDVPCFYCGARVPVERRPARVAGHRRTM